MPNLKQIIEESEKHTSDLFNWADQVKEKEIARWKVMYGFTPEELKTHISSQHPALLNVVNKKYEMIGYILKDIKSYSPDGEIGTLCEQGLDILKDLEIK